MSKLKNRGVQDVFIACVDGLKGFPEAIEAVYPHATVQLCVVHMVRHSLNYVSRKMRKAVAADLRRIYTSTSADEAEQMLGEFEDKWSGAYPPISQSWLWNWPCLTPFFDYPPEIRKVPAEDRWGKALRVTNQTNGNTFNLREKAFRNLADSYPNKSFNTKELQPVAM